jgi:hypothetical protein
VDLAHHPSASAPSEGGRRAHLGGRTHLLRGAEQRLEFVALLRVLREALRYADTSLEIG